MLFLGWPFELLAALLLGGLGLAAAGRVRAWLLGIGSVLLVLGTVCGLVFLDMKARDSADQAAGDKRTAELHETLAAPRQVLDSTLPAGTEVQWTDEARVDFSSVELKQPARVLGVLLKGVLEKQIQTTRWQGELAEDQTVDGWPCRKGEIDLSYTRQLEQCVLAADHAAYGIVYPAGSLLTFLSGYDTHDFTLPADRTMALPLLGVTLPASTKVDIMDGQVHEVELPSGQSVMVHGLPLQSSLTLTSKEEQDGGGAQGDARTEVSSLLASEFSCAGTLFPVDSPITYNLLSGRATAMLRQQDGPDSPLIDITSCVRR